MSEPELDYYKILSVSPKAKLKEIKHAWREKMRKFHPDRHFDERERYEKISREINRAYSELSNPKKRAKFDAARKRALEKPGASGISVLAFGEKIGLTVLTICLTIFLFAIPPWADCGNAFLRYILSGQGGENVAGALLAPSVLIASVFAVTIIVGKLMRERLIFLAFLEVFSLVIACCETLVIPLRGRTEIIVPVLFGVGVFCVYQTYAERKNLIWGTLFRVVVVAACVAAYRAGGLIYRGVDELISVSSLLIFATFLVASITAEFSSNSD